MIYPEFLVAPMRQELTRLGVEAAFDAFCGSAMEA